MQDSNSEFRFHSLCLQSQKIYNPTLDFHKLTIKAQLNGEKSYISLTYEKAII